MKKIYLLFLLISSLNFAQVVTTSPTIPIITSEITVILDVTGTPLESYTGIIYAHTGVTVNAAQWQNVIGTWGNNTAQPALTNTSGNIYEFTITPDIYTYYGVNTADTVTELSFVFRSADGGTQTSDIFINVFEAGLNVVITDPVNESVYSLNDNITISAESNTSADLELKVNNTSVQTVANNTLISTSYTFTSTGLHTIEVVANQGAETKQDEVSIFVKTLLKVKLYQQVYQKDLIIMVMEPLRLFLKLQIKQMSSL